MEKDKHEERSLLLKTLFMFPNFVQVEGQGYRSSSNSIYLDMFTGKHYDKESYALEVQVEKSTNKTGDDYRSYKISILSEQFIKFVKFQINKCLNENMQFDDHVLEVLLKNPETHEILINHEKFQLTSNLPNSRTKTL